MKIGISMLDIKNIKNSPKFKKYACLSVIALCLVGYTGYNFFKTEPVSYMSVNAQKRDISKKPVWFIAGLAFCFVFLPT